MAEIDPIKLSRWQGDVDRHLENIDGSIVELKTAVDTMPDRIEARLHKVINGEDNPGPVEIPPGVMTYRWAFEKAVLPVVLALMTGAIALLYKVVSDYIAITGGP